MIKSLRLLILAVFSMLGLMHNSVNAQSTYSIVARAGETLIPDKAYSSPNGKYNLVFQSSDGNLVVYRGITFTANDAIWGAGSLGGKVAVMQSDGNFVIYGSMGTEVWSSGTQGGPTSGTTIYNYAAITDDGSFAVAGASGRTFKSPKDPSAPATCSTPVKYPICILRGTPNQFTSSVYACSNAEAQVKASAAGGTLGACF